METVNAKVAFRNRQAACPECGAKPRMMPERWDGVMECPECGVKASVSEWAVAPVAGNVRQHSDGPPAGTSIRREETARGVVWSIPARGKFGFFMFFALFWLAITGLVSGGFLMTFLTGGKIEGNMPGWALVPFFGVFWAVGLGMLYAGLREKFLSHQIAVADGKVTLTKRMFGKEKARSLDLGDGTTVRQKEFYQQNYKPVYGIEIRNRMGKLRFGSNLGEEDKAWLVADLGRKVAELERKSGVEVQAGVLEPMSVARPKEVFSLSLPGPGKGGLIGSVLFAVIGIAFFCVGVFVIEGGALPRDGREGGESWFVMLFWLFENGFRAIWLVISSIFALVGIGIFVTTLRRMGNEKRIEGNGSVVAIRTYQRGFMMEEKTFPRSQVSDVRVSQSGSSNGSAMKRMELIVGERAERIADWMEGEKADAIAAELREALGLR